MAVDTLVPFSVVFATVNGKILLIVVPGGRIPCVSGMTVLASRWELCCTMVWVIRPIVIGSMASETSRRRVVVISIGVALIATGACVCAGERPVRIVYRKRSRRPVGCGGVAGRTVVGQVQRHVVGITAGVVIRLVATIAGIGRGGVVPVVAGIAVTGNRNMCTGKRINSIVVERRGRPGIYTVTGLASCGETGSGVVRVIGRIVIGSMASETSRRRVVVISIGVALIATGACVCAGERPVRIVYRKRSRRPVGCGGVAGRTVVGQVQRHVVGITAGVVIRLVATIAGIGRGGVVPVVAGIAVTGNRNMCTGKRINSVVVKSGGRPGCFAVAGGAIRWEL